MPLKLHCAQCGIELLIYRKAVSAQKRVVDLVEPHKCAKIDAEPTPAPDLVLTDKPKPMSIDVKKLFDDFEFVKKLNNLDKKVTVDPASGHIEDHGDKRPKENLRKELSISTAPLGLINQIKPEAKTRPDFMPDGQSEPDEAD